MIRKIYEGKRKSQPKPYGEITVNNVNQNKLSNFMVAQKNSTIRSNLQEKDENGPQQPLTPSVLEIESLPSYFSLKVKVQAS